MQKFSKISLVCSIVFSSFITSVEADECASNGKITVANNANQVILCSALDRDALWGYSTDKKVPIWGSMKVKEHPPYTSHLDGNELQRVDGLSRNKQSEKADYASSGLIGANLLPLYLLTSEPAKQRRLQAMNNIYPISPNKLKGNYGVAIAKGHEKDAYYRIDKGEYQLLVGLVYPDISELEEPSHMFKVYYSDLYDLTLSLLFEVDNKLKHPVSGDNIVSIDCIEKLAGIDIKLPVSHNVELDIENAKALTTDVWARRDGNTEVVTCRG